MTNDRIDGYPWLWQDQARHSGDVCFRGTRVPLNTAAAYRRRSQPIDEFLAAFPSVSRAQAESAWALSEGELARLERRSATGRGSMHRLNG